MANACRSTSRTGKLFIRSGKIRLPCFAVIRSSRRRGTSPRPSPPSHEAASGLDRSGHSVRLGSGGADIDAQSGDAVLGWEPSAQVNGSWRAYDAHLAGSDEEAVRQDRYVDASHRRRSLETTQTELFGYTTALAESFVKPGLLYAGTDDGNVWATRNDGGPGRLAGAVPWPAQADIYVARIDASHFDTLTFYVAFDNHRNNDSKPYLYATHDGGKTFQSIAGNLPADGRRLRPRDSRGPAQPRSAVRGTSAAVYVSTDRGGTWRRFMSGMPTTPVSTWRFIRATEIVAATHGRSFWVADVAPLEDRMLAATNRRICLRPSPPGNGPSRRRAATTTVTQASRSTVRRTARRSRIVSRPTSRVATCASSSPTPRATRSPRCAVPPPPARTRSSGTISFRRLRGPRLRCRCRCAATAFFERRARRSCSTR